MPKEASVVASAAVQWLLDLQDRKHWKYFFFLLEDEISNNL